MIKLHTLPWIIFLSELIPVLHIFHIPVVWNIILQSAGSPFYQSLDRAATERLLARPVKVLFPVRVYRDFLFFTQRVNRAGIDADAASRAIAQLGTVIQRIRLQL